MTTWSTLLTDLHTHRDTCHPSHTPTAHHFQCKPLLQRLNRTLPQFYQESSSSPEALEVFSIALQVKCCPYTREVFGLQKKSKLSKHLSGLLGIMLGGRGGVGVFKELMRLVNVEQFRIVARDAVGFLGRAERVDQNTTWEGFHSCLEDSGLEDGNVRVDVSSRQRKRIAGAGAVEVLGALGEISMAVGVPEFAQGLEIVCRRLEAYPLMNAGDEVECVAWLNNVFALSRCVPSVLCRMRVGKAVLDHAAMGDPLHWGASYCKILASALQEAFQVNYGNSREYLFWVESCSPMLGKLVQGLSKCHGSELSPVRCTSLCLFTRLVLGNRHPIIVDVESTVMANDSSFVNDVQCFDTLGDMLASVIAIAKDGNNVALHALRSAMTLKMSRPQPSKKRTRIDDAGDSLSLICEAWTKRNVELIDTSPQALCVIIRGFSKILNSDDAFLRERGDLLQFAKLHIARLQQLISAEYDESTQIAVAVISAVLAGSFTEQELKSCIPQFKRILGDGSATNPSRLIELIVKLGAKSNDSSIRQSCVLNLRKCPYPVLGRVLRESDFFIKCDVSTVAVLKDLLEVVTNEKLSESQMRGGSDAIEVKTTAATMFLEILQHVKDDCNRVVDLFSNFVGILAPASRVTSESSSLVFESRVRVPLIHAYALTIRKTKGYLKPIQNQSALKFIDALLDKDPAVRVCVAEEIGCLIHDFFIPGSGSSAALASVFQQSSGMENVQRLSTRLKHFLVDTQFAFAKRNVLIAMASIGCELELEASIKHKLLQLALLVLSEEWINPTPFGIITAREQFRRIAKRYGFAFSVHAATCTAAATTILKQPNDTDVDLPSQFSMTDRVDELKWQPVASPGGAVQKLFNFVRPQLYPKLFVSLLSKNDWTESREVLRAFLSNVFGETPATRPDKFLLNELATLLPEYMQRLDSEPMMGKVIEKIARIVYPNSQADGPETTRKLLTENYRAWIVMFADLCAKQQNEAQIRKIESSVTLSAKDLLKLGRKDIIEHYVLKLIDPIKGDANTDTEQIFRVLGTQTLEEAETPVASLVRAEFMFFMNVLSEKVQEDESINSPSSSSNKKHALRCISRLLQLMDKKTVDEFVPKILPTLIWAMQKTDLQVAACRTLKALSIKLSQIALNKNMSGFVVALLPCLTNEHAQAGGDVVVSINASSSSDTQTMINGQRGSPQNVAVDLIMSLLENNAQSLEDGMCWEILELIPDHPALVNVASMLHQRVGTKTLFDRLSLLSKLVARDSDGVRILALEKLSLTLRDNGALLIDAVLHRGTASRETEIVSNMLGSLLRTARAVGARPMDARLNRKISLKCCECLGELSAIDPALLSLSSTRLVGHDFVHEVSDIHTNVDMANKPLAGALLMRFLTDALISAPNPATHMDIGYVIQELVRFSIGTAAVSEKDAGAILSRFLNDDTVLIMRPFAKTNYSVTYRATTPRGRGKSTFFGPGVSYAQSLADWVAHLASLSRGAQRAVFEPLWILKYSDSATRLMLFVLPYVVQNVLCTGSEMDFNAIQREIMFILEDARGEDKANVDAGGRVALSIQAIFVLLDTLNTWVSRHLSQTMPSAGNRRMDATMLAQRGGGVGGLGRYEGEFDDKTKVKRLVDSISKKYLAEAAYRCGSFSRALFYLDEHCRSLHSRDVYVTGDQKIVGGGGVGGLGSWRADETVQFGRDEIELMHKIAAAVESEPDGLRGVVVLRTRHNGGPGTGYELGRRVAALDNLAASSSRAAAVLRISSTTLSSMSSLHLPSWGSPREGDGEHGYAIRGPVSLFGGCQPTLMEQIHEFEADAKWDKALTCYEEALDLAQGRTHLEVMLVPGSAVTTAEVISEEDERGLHEGQLRCLWRAGHLGLLVSVSEGKWNQNPRLRSTAVPYALDALWRLGRWSALKPVLEYLDADTMLGRKGAPGGVSGDYTEALSGALFAAAFSSNEKRGIVPFLEKARLEVLGLLSAASMESYELAYPLLIRLQSLVELERGLSRGTPLVASSSMANAGGGGGSGGTMQDEVTIEKWWADRLKVTSPNSMLRGELLAVRRAVYRISGGQTRRVAQLEAESWLSLAKIARRCGDAAAADSALLNVRRTVAFADQAEDDEARRLALVSAWRSKIQRAELCKERGALEEVLQALEPISELMDLKLFHSTPPAVREVRAKALLLATNALVESGSVQGNVIMDRYERVLKWYPKWEKGQYHFAKYCDSSMTRIQQLSGDGTPFALEGLSMLPGVVRAYCQTVKLGTKHMFEVLPRILTLFYTYADKKLKMEAAADEKLKKDAAAAAQASKDGEVDPTRGQGPDLAALANKRSTKRTPPIPRQSSSIGGFNNSAPPVLAQDKICEELFAIVGELGKTLPPSLWYTALAQLVSRLCHADKKIWVITRSILVRILCTFPERALWNVMVVKQNKNAMRRSRADELFAHFMDSGVESPNTHLPPLSQKKKAFEDAKQLARNYFESADGIFSGLIQLAATEKRNNLNELLDSVRRFQKSSHFGLVVPTQAALTVSSTESSVPAPFFQALGPDCTVLLSKAKPKKISLLSSEGTSINFVCKNESRGDLRKDSRLMEFNAVVNELLSRDVQARKRRLHLRTYAVICLNELCGLLEWMENTEGFRGQCLKVYMELKKYYVNTMQELLTSVQSSNANDPELRLSEYRKLVQTSSPPRFHKWFLRNFHDPAAWLAARTLFTRSIATWSMVGFIVGLGDRHADNLLMDMSSGEMLHVDFDVLFDKGLSLGIPEIVPFRLTQNMVDGMGLTGVEGSFRATCEISMGILRANKTMLLSVLESFIVDPLVEWQRPQAAAAASSHKDGQAVPDRQDAPVKPREEANIEMAKTRLDAISERLSGVVRDREQIIKSTPMIKRNGRVSIASPSHNQEKESGFLFEALPLSTQGQVDRLIQEATDERKLMQMFVGWLPFL